MLSNNCKHGNIFTAYFQNKTVSKWTNQTKICSYELTLLITDPDYFVYLLYHFYRTIIIWLSSSINCPRKCLNWIPCSQLGTHATLRPLGSFFIRYHCKNIIESCQKSSPIPSYTIYNRPFKFNDIIFIWGKGCNR